MAPKSILLLCTFVVYVYGNRWGNKDCKDSLVVFGAGYEDDGVSPPDDLVGLHKYSTGKGWPQYVADQMNMKLFNYAVAGGLSGVDNLYFKGWSGNKWQVDEYLRVNSKIPNNTLFGVATGAINEMFFNIYTDEALNGMVNNIMDCLKKLITAGATKMFVLNLPDYTMAPTFRAGVDNNTEEGNQASRDGVLRHNAKMAAALDDLSKQNPAVRIVPIDFHKYWEEGIESMPYKTTYAMVCVDGFVQPGDVYANGTSHPDDILKYAFFDMAHPSSGVHLHIATNIQIKLREAGIMPSWKK